MRFAQRVLHQPQLRVAVVGLLYFGGVGMTILSSGAFSQDTRAGQLTALGRIVTDVRDARDLAKSTSDPRLRDQIDQLLARAELAARDLQQAMARQNPVASRPGAMSGPDFSAFLAALSKQSFDDGKLATVKTLGQARLTAAQAKQILQKFAFDKGREEAAVFLHPLLVDPHLFAVTLEAMAFPKSREAVMKRIAP